MSLDIFFKPKSIAVFGVSRNLEKPGRVLYENLIKCGFRGEVYPLNPNLQELDGKKVVSPEELPKVDLGIFVIPAPIVPESLRQVASKLKGALVIAGGFGEVGRKDLDQQLLEITEEFKIRLWGPNCVGLINPYLNLNATFFPTERIDMPTPGKIALLSQSGATIASLIDWSNKMKIGFSKIASYGNQLDVNETEILQYFMKDKKTKALGFYLEGLKDGKEFLRKVKITKPVIALKAGKTEKGILAAKSHTGAMAGSYKIYEGVFSQMGISMSRDIESLLDSLKLLDSSKPKGKRVAVITCGGGYGVMASDALEASGLELSNLSKKTLTALKKHYSERVVIGNPIDLTGSATPDDFGFAFRQISKDKSVDAILTIFLFQLPTLNESVVNELPHTDKPMVIVSPPGKFASKVNALLVEKWPVVSTPEEAAYVFKSTLK
ncbi:MAG: CoA-binding protein [Candidatus Altiarchaeota archaeon]|nr:CoA-binding protein [Candidatus Altiarchaeota archaeon]